MTDEQSAATSPSFSTKKSVLQSLLESCGTVLPTKALVPVLQHFQIAATNDELRVISTDLQLTMLATTPLVTVATPGVAVFPGQKLLSICREAADGDVEIEVIDGTAHISIGRAVWELKLKDPEEYPEIPDTAEIEFHTINRAAFVKAVRSVAKAAARESTRANLMMLDINAGRMRASDGVRFQQATLEDWPKDFNLQIPIGAVDDLLKLLRWLTDQTFEVGETATNLVFRVKGDVFMAAKLIVAFPPVDKTLLKPWMVNDQKLTCEREELASAIKRVRIASDPETPAVILSLSESAIVVKSKDKSGSTAEEAVDATWTGAEDRKVAFNAQQLLDMLSMTDAQSCTFMLGEDKKAKPSALLLRDDENGLVGVLNQMRVEWIS